MAADGTFARFGAWRTRGVRGDDVQYSLRGVTILVERVGY